MKEKELVRRGQEKWGWGGGAQEGEWWRRAVSLPEFGEWMIIIYEMEMSG